MKINFPKLENPLKMWRQLPKDGKIWLIFLAGLFASFLLVDLIKLI